MVWIRRGVAAVPRVRVSGRLDELSQKKRKKKIALVFHDIDVYLNADSTTNINL